MNDRPRVIVRRVRWLWPAWAAAMVPAPGLVLVRVGVNLTPALLAHELAHVLQWAREGIAFAWRYLLAHVRYGYERNPYEREARALERDPAMLEWARELLEAGA